MSVTLLSAEQSFTLCQACYQRSETWTLHSVLQGQEYNQSLVNVTLPSARPTIVFDHKSDQGRPCHRDEAQRPADPHVRP